MGSRGRGRGVRRDRERWYHAPGCHLQFARAGKNWSVRSVRPTDTQEVWPIGGIFAYSGGAPYAIASIGTVPGLKLVDESSAGTAMFRDLSLLSPHNLFGVGPGALRVWRHSDAAHAALYLPTSDPEGDGTQDQHLHRQFPEHLSVTWTWDTATSSWDRTLVW
jgi:hypothetical protein